MIELCQKKSCAAPVIICDVCHKEITDAHEALVTWQMTRGFTPGPIPVCFCHKGACDDNDVYQCSMTLDVFLVYLLNNSGLHDKKKLEQARHNAGWLARV